MTGRTHTRTDNATERLRAAFEENRRGLQAGVYSVCSANRYALEAAMQQALQDQSLLLIESTSNQVNQFGGYTGLTPAEFVKFLKTIAQSMHFPREQIVLGGDHLGPHVWRKESSAQAMEKACVLVRDSVVAGYTKIHLDTSMHCADDGGDRGQPLADEIICERAALLCKAAEEAYRTLGAGQPEPLYVIGTEVPIPGGELNGTMAPEVTRVEHLERTLQIAKQAFRTHKLEAAWDRVIAVVVQPGVEFGDSAVFVYDEAKVRPLSQFAAQHWHGVYEAHSTDYQPAAALQRMVRDHFAILKVGPWLTFAFREAVLALEAIEEEWLGQRGRTSLSHLRRELEQAMVENPGYWKNYYRGDEAALRFARAYSLSDRSRYYWPQARVASALERLLNNLSASTIPFSLVSQYLPQQATLIREGQLEATPTVLIRSKIQAVLSLYANACGSDGRGNSTC